MSNLINFNFENNQVRTAIKDDGDVYFCLSDVADILSLEKATPNRFNLDERGAHKMSITDNLGRNQEANFINEPNLYRVIFRSNKPEAVKFQNWVFNEVLPAIRKTGKYEPKPTKPATPAEMLLMVAEQMVITERKTAELDLRLTAIEQKQQRLDQNNDHYTIKGFCALHGLGLSNGKMSALSKKAKQLSCAKDYSWHEITDPRFGKVHCYHVDILTELFALNHLL